MHNNASVELQLTDSNGDLYFFFGGIAAGIAMPVFEFYESAKILNHSKIFLRDFRQCWYQKGLPGVGSDIRSIQDFVHRQINQIGPRQVFFVGNSMGGFAAILLATLIGAGEAIAFAPQTFIDPQNRLRHWDMRWPRQILGTYIHSAFRHHIWDLQPLLQQSAGSPKISIFVSMDDRLDYIHAMRVNGLPGVHVHEFQGGGHKVVKMLKNQGKLPEIMSGRYAG